MVDKTRRKQRMRLLLPQHYRRDVVDAARRAAPRRARRGAAQAGSSNVAARVAAQVLARAHVAEDRAPCLTASRRPRAAATNYEGATRPPVEHGARLPRARAAYAHGAARAAPLAPGAAAPITGLATIIKTGTSTTTSHTHIFRYNIIRK